MANLKIFNGAFACAALLCFSMVTTTSALAQGIGRASYRAGSDFGRMSTGYAEDDLPGYGSDRLRDYSNYGDYDMDYDLPRSRELPRSRRYDDELRYNRSDRVPMRSRYRGDFDLDQPYDRDREPNFDLDRLYNRGRNDRSNRNDDRYDRDLPPYPRTTPRRPQNPGPFPPSIPHTPRPNGDELSLNEQLTRRYQDERVIRVLTQLTAQSGESFFLEVSQMIDSRHIEPTSYAERVRNGFEHLATALSNPAFQQATGINPNYGDIQSLQGQFASMARQANARSQAEAVGAIRQAAQMAQQAVGLNPGVVYLMPRWPRSTSSP
jgi:hypothetical protein